ncbi:Fatty acyl-CoA reductase 2 [Frankliniella fusca]|uniref:Fatty acyl-CoA reductase n=1 Tax=Frankliniella fusca TaxID=407009 RepID=A0AAE1LET1_9NEOP|nr:Fatty acyl-CoA reductase 2 [Frankliniella fusca]
MGSNLHRTEHNTRSFTSRLREMWKRLQDFHPNSYTFTKALAEQLIDDVAAELPVVIVRPSIVVPTHKDPMPGWIDNLYGLGAMWTAGQKGLIRVHCIEEFAMDSVPADIVTKTTVLASWARALDIRIRPLPVGVEPKGVEVVHATIGSLGCTFGDMEWALTEDGLLDKLAFPGAIRDPKFYRLDNPIAYQVLHWYHHILYGVVLDTAARLTGRKPRALNLYRKFVTSCEATAPFVKPFVFEGINQRLLQILMHPADEEAYCFMDMYEGRDNVDTFRKWSYETIRGVLVYALKEEDNYEKHRPHHDRRVP